MLSLMWGSFGYDEIYHQPVSDGGPLSVADSPRDSRRRGPHCASHAPLAGNLWVSRHLTANANNPQRPTEMHLIGPMPREPLSRKVSPKRAISGYLKFAIQPPNPLSIDAARTPRDAPESKRFAPVSRHYSPPTAQISILMPFDPCNIGKYMPKNTPSLYIPAHLGDL